MKNMRYDENTQQWVLDSKLSRGEKVAFVAVSLVLLVLLVSVVVSQVYKAWGVDGVGGVTAVVLLGIVFVMAKKRGRE